MSNTEAAWKDDAEKVALFDLVRDPEADMAKREEALESLSMPEDREIIVELIADRKAGKEIKAKASYLLPEDDPVLNWLCCPACGAIDAVVHQSGYDNATNTYYQTYKCLLCGHNVVDRSKTGEVLAKSFSIRLRDMREM